jgi:hypothetical protein
MNIKTPSGLFWGREYLRIIVPESFKCLTGSSAKVLVSWQTTHAHNAQRLAASKVHSLGTIKSGWHIGQVLNALRHQRFIHARFFDIRKLTEQCSTPYGIKSSFTQSHPLTAQAIRKCSTPYGIKGSFTATGFGFPLSNLNVLNALRHQRFIHVVRGEKSVGAGVVLNALRHQRFIH